MLSNVDGLRLAYHDYVLDIELDAFEIVCAQWSRQRERVNHLSLMSNTIIGDLVGHSHLQKDVM